VLPLTAAVLAGIVGAVGAAAAAAAVSQMGRVMMTLAARNPAVAVAILLHGVSPISMVVPWGAPAAHVMVASRAVVGSVVAPHLVIQALEQAPWIRAVAVRLGSQALSLHPVTQVPTAQPAALLASCPPTLATSCATKAVNAARLVGPIVLA